MPFAPCGAPIHRSPTENYTARLFDYLIRWVGLWIRVRVVGNFTDRLLKTIQREFSNFVG